MPLEYIGFNLHLKRNVLHKVRSTVLVYEGMIEASDQFQKKEKRIYVNKEFRCEGLLIAWQ